MYINLVERIKNRIPFAGKYQYVYVSSGLVYHVKKRHINCVVYLDNLEYVISTADYIGVNPNEKGKSFELVKQCENNILVAIKLDVLEDRLYVASVYDITSSKLMHGINNGRFKKI